MCVCVCVCVCVCAGFAGAAGEVRGSIPSGQRGSERDSHTLWTRRILPVHTVHDHQQRLHQVVHRAAGQWHRQGVCVCVCVCGEPYDPCSNLSLGM